MAALQIYKKSSKFTEIAQIQKIGIQFKGPRFLRYKEVWQKFKAIKDENGYKLR